MKKVLIDTNVLIDIIQKRSPFFNDSFSAVKKCIYEKNKMIISAHSVLDLMYICRKDITSGNISTAQIKKLLKIFKIEKISKNDINKAFESNIKDFEDAVIEKLAYRKHAKLIITRNAKDFVNSRVEVCTPTEFLAT